MDKSVVRYLFLRMREECHYFIVVPTIGLLPSHIAGMTMGASLCYQLGYKSNAVSLIPKRGEESS